MRTTVDIPDDLLRRAKIRAAERGMTLKEIVALGVERELAIVPATPERKGMGRPVPIVLPSGAGSHPRMSNAEIFERLDREEDLAKGRIVE